MPAVDALLSGRLGQNMGTMGGAGKNLTQHSTLARFYIPDSLVALIPQKVMPDFQYRLAWHQYRCMHLAVDLRHNLSMPHELGVAPWCPTNRPMRWPYGT